MRGGELGKPPFPFSRWLILSIALALIYVGGTAYQQHTQDLILGVIVSFLVALVLIATPLRVLLTRDIDRTLSRTRRSLARRETELTTLHNLPAPDASGADMPRYLRACLDLLLQHPALEDRGAIFLVKQKKQALVLVAQKNLPSSFVENDYTVGLGECLCGICVDGKGLVTSLVPSDDPRCSRPCAPCEHGMIIVPLAARLGVEGVALLYAATEAAFDRETIDTLESAGQQIGLVVESVRLEQLMRTRVKTDELTGLLSHRSFLDTLSREMNRASRTGCDLSLVVLDIEGFRRLNLERGHRFADQVLVRTGRLLRRNVRSMDTVGRCGPDEFGIILPEANADAAVAKARLLIDTVSRISMAREDRNEELAVSLHAGVAQSSGDDDADGFFESARHALVTAQRSASRVAVSRPSRRTTGTATR